MLSPLCHPIILRRPSKTVGASRPPMFFINGVLKNWEFLFGSPGRKDPYNWMSMRSSAQVERFQICERSHREPYACSNCYGYGSYSLHSLSQTAKAAHLCGVASSQVLNLSTRTSLMGCWNSGAPFPKVPISHVRLCWGFTETTIQPRDCVRYASSWRTARNGGPFEDSPL